MRTTLDIDDDVLRAAKELAARNGETAGKVLSELARRGIQDHGGKMRRKTVHGFEILPAQGRIVTPQLVQRILEKSWDV
jgi:hypothetical protein